MPVGIGGKVGIVPGWILWDGEGKVGLPIQVDIGGAPNPEFLQVVIKFGLSERCGNPRQADVE